MGKKVEYKVVSYIKIGDKIVPWDSIAQEEKKNLVEKMMQNVGSALSSYLSANPDEIENVIRSE